MKAKTAILLLFVLLATGAEAVDWDAQVFPLFSAGEQRQAVPGEALRVSIRIENVTTNTLVLSLGNSLFDNWRGSPEIVLSVETNETTGQVTTHLPPRGGGTMYRLDGGPSIVCPEPPAEYVFVKPRQAFQREITVRVPEYLAHYPFSNATYRATVYATDTGEADAIQAWTGTIAVIGFDIPLKREPSQTQGQRAVGR